jgi:DNA-directed RNA polymerase subunit K/omega
MNSAISMNKFLKVMIVTQRAKQLRKGARALVQSSSARATRIALEEVEQGLIGFEFIPGGPDLRSGGDNRGDRGQGDVENDNRKVTNQAPVKSQTSIVRPGDQDARFFPIHRRFSLAPKTTFEFRIIGMVDGVSMEGKR